MKSDEIHSKQKHNENEYIDFETISDEDLRKIKGLDLLNPDSKEKFLNKCSKIIVPEKVHAYDDLIKSHEDEMLLRKASDKGNKFRDSDVFMLGSLKPKIRNNIPVIPIEVSDERIKRAYRIVNTFIKAVKEFNGTAVVERYVKQDNLMISIFGEVYFFTIIEQKEKNRRRNLGRNQDKSINSFRPMYEKSYNGVLEIKLKRSLTTKEKEEDNNELSFIDKPDYKLEDFLGEIFINLRKNANEVKGLKIIKNREETRFLEKRRLEHEIKVKEEKLKERFKQKQLLIQNIENHMGNWIKSKELFKYAEDLEKEIHSIDDEKDKEMLSLYIKLVKEKAESLKSVKEIIDEMKSVYGDIN